MSPISYADKMSPLKWAERDALAKKKKEEEAKELEPTTVEAPLDLFLLEDPSIARPLSTAPIPEPKPVAAKKSRTRKSA